VTVAVDNGSLVRRLEYHKLACHMLTTMDPSTGKWLDEALSDMESTAAATTTTSDDDGSGGDGGGGSSSSNSSSSNSSNSNSSNSSNSLEGSGSGSGDNGDNGSESRGRNTRPLLLKVLQGMGIGRDYVWWQRRERVLHEEIKLLMQVQWCRGRHVGVVV
jgi:hypothetical protein